jgi:hypothetical protein
VKRVRRRDRPKSGYSLPAVPGFLLAAVAVSFLLAVVWSGFTWPFPAAPRWADLIVAAVLGALAVIRYARWRRSLAGRSVRGLTAAMKEREGGVWINREEGQGFTVYHRGLRWFPFWMVTRISADSADDDSEHEGGERPVLTETYATIPLAARVVRVDEMILADDEAGTVRTLPSPGRLREIRQLRKSARTGFGFIAVRPEEAAVVLAQLRGSEPAPGTGGDEED